MTSDGGSVYVADTGNGRIVRFDPAGNVIGVWAMPTYTIVANGQTINGRIEPRDVAVDGSGRVIVPDATHNPTSSPSSAPMAVCSRSSDRRLPIPATPARCAGRGASR